MRVVGGFFAVVVVVVVAAAASTFAASTSFTFIAFVLRIKLGGETDQRQNRTQQVKRRRSGLHRRLDKVARLDDDGAVVSELVERAAAGVWQRGAVVELAVPLRLIGCWGREFLKRGFC